MHAFLFSRGGSRGIRFYICIHPNYENIHHRQILAGGRSNRGRPRDGRRRQCSVFDGGWSCIDLYRQRITYTGIPYNYYKVCRLSLFCTWKRTAVFIRNGNRRLFAYSVLICETMRFTITSPSVG